jgi:hypothetical protein
MRLAHHLLRRPSGMWYFRIYIPKDLRSVFGMTIFKRSLGTHDPVSARTCAYALGARCAQIFASARIGTKDLGMDWDDLLSKIERFEIKAGPDGVSVKTNGTDADNAAGMKALQMALDKPLWPAPKPGSDASQPKLNRVSPKQRSDAPTLAQALRQYEEVEAKNIKPNTWMQRQRSSASFLKYIGSGVKVDEVTRPMAAASCTQRSPWVCTAIATSMRWVPRSLQRRRIGFRCRSANVLARVLRSVQVIQRVLGALAELADRFRIHVEGRELPMAAKLDTDFQLDQARAMRAATRQRLADWEYAPPLLMFLAKKAGNDEGKPAVWRTLGQAIENQERRVRELNGTKGRPPNMPRWSGPKRFRTPATGGAADRAAQRSVG